MTPLPRLRPNINKVKADGPEGRLRAAAAQRNEAGILEVLARHAPDTGLGFEIASGTGQHIAAFAHQHQAMSWQPSDIAGDQLTSIRAWRDSSNLDNLLDPIEFDATRAAWPGPAPDLVILVNLLHLISDDEAWQLISNVAGALRPGGKFLFYGPFLRSGATTSEADRQFNQSLQTMDPSIGYKNDAAIRRWLTSRGLEIIEVVEMPANNLMWVARKSA